MGGTANAERADLRQGADITLSYETYGESITLRSGDIVIPRIDSVEPLKVECGHFMECALASRTPRCDGKDGLRVLRVLEEGQRSLEKHAAPVELGWMSAHRVRDLANELELIAERVQPPDHVDEQLTHPPSGASFPT